MKLYRINIHNFEDPLQNKRLLELVGTERRKKVIRYRMPDDRKRSLAAGLIIQKILNENGLSEDSLKYSENGKPFADNLFLMYPMQEIMWSECLPIVKSGVTLKKLWMHHLEFPTVFFI